MEVAVSEVGKADRRGENAGPGIKAPEKFSRQSDTVVSQDDMDFMRQSLHGRRAPADQAVSILMITAERGLSEPTRA